jgi:putative aldouronate transport system substrate-binding protein
MKRTLALIIALAMSLCAGAFAEEYKVTGEEITLPIAAEPLTLSMFHVLNAKMAKTMTDYNEILLFQEMEKRTGIHIEFRHPAIGSEQETINLMVAAGDYPDMVNHGWANPVGGITHLINEGLITDLKDDIAKWAPNIQRQYVRNPRIRVNTSTDDGKILFFPMIYDEMYQRAQYGFFLRSDWLEKVGLPPPVTIDDYYNVLTAFKTQDPNGNGVADEIPFASVGYSFIDYFLGAWQLTTATTAFSNNDGTARYAPLQPEYKEFVTMMAKWYEEGLIDPEYLSKSQQDVDNMMANSISGMTVERNSKTAALRRIFLNTGMEEANLMGTRYPVLEEGQQQACFQSLALINGGGVAIPDTNKHRMETVKWLDYFYSDEGYELANWGPEGNEMYTVGEDGQKHLTAYALDNPDGLSMDEAIARISLGSVDSWRRYDPELYQQRMMTFPEQLTTNTLWDTDTNFDLRFPMVAYTPEETEEMIVIQSECNTYTSEMVNKFIMGKAPLSEYDNYVATLKSLGAQRLQEIAQAALDRYFNRK